ncbi:MAG: biopolymer transporter ExbD [Pseudomonadota bacterium]
MPKRRQRRKLSMTPLIDVIFLLLLFFMLSSTFSKFSEVELTSGGAGSAIVANDTPPIFVRMFGDVVRINGQEVPKNTLREVATALITEPRMVLISLDVRTDAQALTDVLVTLRGVKGASVMVLES